MNIPQKIYAGDTVEWTDSVSDYLASAGYTLTYVLSGMNKKITFDGTADGDDFDFTLTAATTGAWVGGWYQWQAYVTLLGQRYTVDTGRVEIISNLAIAGGIQDGRSIWQITFDNLETVIKNKSTEGYENQTVNTANGTFAIGKMTWDEILNAYNYAKRQLTLEQSGGKKKKIYMSFA